jgi:hypothetical protein
MTARLYALAGYALPFASLQPLATLVLAQLFGSVK